MSADTGWKLESFKVEFRQGYNWEQDEAKRVDRYEGVVTFENKVSEKFTVKLNAAKCGIILELLAGQIINTAQELADRIRLELTQ
jgi:hypothetical protein